MLKSFTILVTYENGGLSREVVNAKDQLEAMAKVLARHKHMSAAGKPLGAVKSVTVEKEGA